MPNLYKNAIRNSYRKVRNFLPKAFQIKASRQISATISSLDFYQKAKKIGLYFSAFSEVDVDSLWLDAMALGKNCYFPVSCANKTLLFLPGEKTTPYRSNRFNILEPALPLSMAIPLTQLDILFIPLVSFDATGTRLGMGGGFYDKTLQTNNKPLLVGLAYAFQQSPTLPRDAWDVPLDRIVTEESILWIR